MRNLRYVRVEVGACKHCGRDARDHSTEGICNPLGLLHLPHEPNTPEPCYRGYEEFAFIDLDSPEATTWLGRGVEAGVS